MKDPARMIEYIRIWREIKSFCGFDMEDKTKAMEEIVVLEGESPSIVEEIKRLDKILPDE